MEAHRRNMEGIMPVYDEGWWISVLADEECYSPLALARHSRSNGKPKSMPDLNRAKEIYQRDEIVSLHVTGCNRGGLLVEGEGLYGFVPLSHLVDMAGRNDLANKEEKLAAYVGCLLRLKVIECIPEDGRVVFSERAAQAEAGRRTRLFESLQPGQCIYGEVTNITEFGAFVDLGGVEGLIHISELSWGRVGHPSQIVHLGERVEVQVLEVLPERCRVALSLKRLFPNPWETAKVDYTVNQIVPAVVTTVVSFGAFARLPGGLEGLIHASEMPLTPGMPVKDLLTEGQQIQVCILHIDSAHQRLGLRLKLDD